MRIGMQKELIIRRLKEKGCRITKQRLLILDVILDEDCSCGKEIYYKVSKLDSKIGFATVYRMINTLEEIGVISRKNVYRIACEAENTEENSCVIEFEDDTVLELTKEKWNQVLCHGLEAIGYRQGKQIRNVIPKTEPGGM